MEKKKSNNHIKIKKTNGSSPTINSPDRKHKKQKKEIADPVVEISLRREFYKDQAGKIMKLAFFSTGLVVISLVALIYAINKEPGTIYVSVDSEGRMIEIIPLAEPNYKDSIISSWLSRALVDTFDLNYVNMKSNLNRTTTEYFTDEGREKLLKELVDSGYFDTISSKKLIMSLSVDNVPLVVRKGNVGFTKSYLWKLEVPATITYRTESSVYSNKLLFTVTIARRSLAENPDGLGITRIVIENDKRK